MKYFCLGQSFPLVKVTYSPKFWENLPGVGTPIFGKLPVTENVMRTAFDASKEFYLCKSLEDANALRHAKILKGNTNVTPEFFRGAIAEGYPLGDYAIYEVEVSDTLSLDFKKLNTLIDSELKGAISFDLYFRATIEKNPSLLPQIDICVLPKEIGRPQLLSCHYLSLVNNQEEIQRERSCNIL